MRYLALVILALAVSAGAQTSVPGWNITGAGSGGGGTTCGTPTCTISSTGLGNGVLALAGNTSGTATFTAPSVAGTSTNGVTMSNVLLGPAGAAGTPTYSFSGDTSSGLYSGGAGALRLAVSGTDNILMTAGNNQLSTNSGLTDLIGTTTTYIRFGSGHNASISQSAGGGSLFSFGNGTQNDETALIREGNACRVTADITLTVNTATTVCTWTLPAVAKAWAWQCQIPWVISAGTGTNTLAIIANASQTPTAATNGSAEIKTTNTNTATEATTAISASGATTLLTSGTITPNAAVFMSSTSGTLLASATAGTFAIQMTAAGTTATAAAKAGATCYLY